MSLTFKEYSLNEETVEEISSELETYLKGIGLERPNILRLRFTLEELLLNIMSGCGRDLKIKVGIGKAFGRRQLRLRYVSEAFDPTKTEENDWAYELMHGLGYLPSWTCRGRVNTVSLVLAEKAKRSTLVNIFIAVALAVLLGLGGGAIPENLRQGISDVLLEPLSKSFLGLMGTFSGVMIAFTIIQGILGAGDSITLGKIGKLVISRILIFSFAISVAAAFIVTFFLNLNWAAAVQGNTSQIKSISQMIFNILPSNPVEPFSSGNILQIIVIALFAGIGILALGERASRVRGLVEELAALTQYILSGICGLIPFFVFTMLLRQIWGGQASTFLAVGKIILLIFGIAVLLAAGIWLFTSVRLKCPPMLLLKKILPVFMIAFTTASSMSALPLGMETCKRKLGIDESIVSFAYPIGTVMYMPSTVVTYTVASFAFAEIYQVEINFSWILAAIITMTLTIIALPPIPGGGLLVYMIMFAQLGIPSEALVLGTAMDVVIDFLDTGLNVALQMLRIVDEANILHKLDRDTLLGKS